MQAVLADWYLWLKVGHIFAFVAWMAGIFYLPRLFVYHAERATPGSELSETFKVMELRLFRAIMNPSMIAAWTFGLLMLWANGLDWLVASPWMWVKLGLVFWMTWFHHWLGRRRKEFAADANTRTGRHYRIMNEVPTLAFLGIVIMVIVQPF